MNPLLEPLLQRRTKAPEWDQYLFKNIWKRLLSQYAISFHVCPKQVLFIKKGAHVMVQRSLGRSFGSKQRSGEDTLYKFLAES